VWCVASSRNLWLRKPGGVGAERTPPLFLAKGDDVVVRGEDLGELRNRRQRVDLHGDTHIAIID
jgi:hypothetical protein